MQPYTKILLPILAVVVVDAFSITLPTVMFPDLLRTRFSLDQTAVSNLVGLFDSLVSASLILSSLAIGYFSDFFGRKPLMILGLLANVISLSILAFSSNLPLIFIARICGYSLNGVWVLSCALISDHSGNNAKLRCLSFAYTASAWSFSRAIASGLGGVLTFETHPSFFPDQFVLPVLTGCLLQVLGVVNVLFFVSEPRSTSIDSNAIRRVPSVLNSECPMTPMSAGKSDECTVPVLSDWTPSLIDDDRSRDGSKSTTTRVSFIQGLKLICSNRILLKSCLVYCINQFGNGATLVILVLFNTLSKEEGGLGFSSAAAGAHFLVFGLVSVLFQLVFVKRLLERFLLQKIVLVGQVSIAIGNLISPFSVVFSNPWPFLLFSVVFIAFGWICGSLSLSICTNAAESCNCNGLVHGSLNSAVSVSRMMGSITGGLLFGSLVRIGIPWVIGLLPFISYLTVSCLVYRLPSSINT
ncbi:hypothetical protein GEMRC1_001333 [Eukaryota sp. GEM-RC1]